MAMASTSSSSRPPLLHPASKTPNPHRLLPLASRAAAPRPLLLSLAPPAPARGLRAAAAQQPAYEDGEEEEEEEDEYYSDEEDEEEEMDVEAMEEEARRAAADLAARLDRELRVGECKCFPFGFHLFRGRICILPW
jgi:GTP-binding protein